MRPAPLAPTRPDKFTKIRHRTRHKHTHKQTTDHRERPSSRPWSEQTILAHTRVEADVLWWGRISHLSVMDNVIHTFFPPVNVEPPKDPKSFQITLSNAVNGTNDAVKEPLTPP